MKVLGNLTLENIVISMIHFLALPLPSARRIAHLRVKFGLERLDDLLPILMRGQTTSGGAADGMSRIELDIEWIKRMAAGAD